MAFHRRQMDALPTLISGLDPDPPVLLCPRTEKFDELLCQELRAAGWPSSGKSAEQRKANPPAPIKGAVLARKLAKGNALTSDDVKLLAERIAWLQRNWFRWSARNGYPVLAAAKAQGEALPKAPENVALMSPSERTDRPKEEPELGAATDARRDLFQDISPRTSVDRKEAHTAETEGNTSTVLPGGTGKNDGHGDPNDGSMARSKEPAEASQTGDSVDKFDAALASLRDISGNEDVPSFDDYAKTIGGGGSDEADEHLISLRTGHIKSVEGDEVQSFLFAIYYKKSREEIERRARALAADRAQLSGALSRRDSTSQDIREAFAKLGLDADA
ncbi:MAG: hypothetical protein V2I43_05950 [Parvularcula sp.]|nr:hypothetical protein [Parvularcula sp.]